MKIVTRFCFLIIIFLAQSSPASSSFNQNLENYNNLVKIIDDQDKQIASFKVAIADNDQLRRYGLMNLEKLAKEYGMLFIFDRSNFISMWMKDTMIPLDMLFIDGNNIIQDIKLSAKPYSLEIIKSKQKVDKVLEINAGLVDYYGIKQGYKVIVN